MSMAIQGQRPVRTLPPMPTVGPRISTANWSPVPRQCFGACRAAVFAHHGHPTSTPFFPARTPNDDNCQSSCCLGLCVVARTCGPGHHFALIGIRSRSPSQYLPGGAPDLNVNGGQFTKRERRQPTGESLIERDVLQDDPELGLSLRE